MTRNYTPTPPHVLTTPLEDTNISLAALHIATVHPASPEYATEVLEAEIDNDGRSDWVWVNLANGDLLLGTFPRGLTYERIEKDAQFVFDTPPTPLSTLEAARATIVLLHPYTPHHNITHILAQIDQTIATIKGKS
jgi:hypothetical protein